MIERQTKNMTLLLDDLLDVSRITHGKVELKKRRVGIGEIVEAATETARPLMDAKRHVLTVLDCRPHAPELEVDALRMAQVLTNLLTNAAKYTDAGGHVRLEVAIDGDSVSFEVSDDRRRHRRRAAADPLRDVPPGTGARSTGRKAAWVSASPCRKGSSTCTAAASRPAATARAAVRASA